MNYYEVLPRDPGYRPDKSLTYSSKQELARGNVVLIPLKEKKILGFITKKVTRPAFPTKQIIEDYIDLPPIPDKVIELLEWLHQYYPGPMGSVVQQFLPKKIVPILPPVTKQSKKRNSSKLPVLTTEQIQTLKKIKRGGPNLIHGDTGTGKTRVYIELAQEAIKKQRSALILTPEISLTSQLTANFKEVFGQKVVLIHSGLSDKERLANWLRILSGKEALVVLGPRSALFSPFSDLGLIVVDEAHEEAYKQDSSPHYHAVRLASMLAGLFGATFVLGSATPSVTDYFLAEQRNIPVLRMQDMAVDKKVPRPEIEVVDLAAEYQASRNPYLSKSLLEAISKALDNKEQVLLFLNRRGTARVVLCENCGWHYLCPRCDLPLVYHGDSHTMQCHTCGFLQTAPTTCPVCHQDKIIFKGVGTKAIAEFIQKIFPQASLRRFDSDNKKSERFEQNYEDVKSGKIDILIGTQTITKGLDLPRLSVVGVILAETSLYLPDYTSSEKTYQLLTQVMGRVGRGHRTGKVIIQSYDPTNSVIASVVKRTWGDFYQSEISEREKFLFPPFCYLMKLSCRRASRESAIRASKQLMKNLGESGLKIQALGPAPAFYEKVGGKFQWQVIVKAKQRNQLIEVIKILPSGWSHNIDPVNLL